MDHHTKPPAPVNFYSILVPLMMIEPAYFQILNTNLSIVEIRNKYYIFKFLLIVQQQLGTTADVFCGTFVGTAWLT